MFLNKTAILSDLGAVLGRLGIVLGRSWALLEVSWPLLECSWEPLGAILAALGSEPVVFQGSGRPRTGSNVGGGRQRLTESDFSRLEAVWSSLGIYIYIYSTKY